MFWVTWYFWDLKRPALLSELKTDVNADRLWKVKPWQRNARVISVKMMKDWICEWTITSTYTQYLIYTYVHLIQWPPTVWKCLKQSVLENISLNSYFFIHYLVKTLMKNKCIILHLFLYVFILFYFTILYIYNIKIS